MKRFKALDVFRGLTICLMIIVNTSGDWNFTFGPLLHANWHGFTTTDLVFPSSLYTAFSLVIMYCETICRYFSFSDVDIELTSNEALKRLNF